MRFNLRFILLGQAVLVHPACVALLSVHLYLLCPPPVSSLEVHQHLLWGKCNQNVYVPSGNAFSPCAPVQAAFANERSISSGSSDQVASGPLRSSASVSSTGTPHSDAGPRNCPPQMETQGNAQQDGLSAGSASSSCCNTIERGVLSDRSPTDKCLSTSEDVMTASIAAHFDCASSVRPDLVQGLATA